MRNCATIVFILATVLGGASLAAEYFPSEDGLEFQYSTGPLVIREMFGGEIWRYTCEGCFISSAAVYYMDGSGDVFYKGYEAYCDAAPDPSGTFYEPDLLYLDFPLEDGKVWTTETTEYEMWASLGDSLVVTSTVLGAKTVTVDAGEFEVIAVEVEYVYPLTPWYNRVEERWFHRQLGPVNGLISWSGIVSTDEASWDEVKALFK